jgi:hypothetical protein
MFILFLASNNNYEKNHNIVYGGSFKNNVIQLLLGDFDWNLELTNNLYINRVKKEENGKANIYNLILNLLF